MLEVEKAKLEVWKTTVDVQKHFNDLGLRVRSIAITVLGAFLAASGYALKEGEKVDVAGQQLSLTGLILLGGLVCWSAFFVMDRLWYHRLLKAAVKHGRLVEDDLRTAISTVGLTITIDEGSPLLGLRAGHRLTIFYTSIAALLFAAAVIALAASRWFSAIGFVFILAPLVFEYIAARIAKLKSSASGKDTAS